MATESLEPARVCNLPAHCPACGSPNGCRLETGEPYKGLCWCEHPVLLSSSIQRLLVDLPEPRCLCAKCLDIIAANPEVTWEELTAGRRPATSAAPRDGDFYMENDCLVFTAQYHLRRGWCCGSGCRHCPFQ